MRKFCVEQVSNLIDFNKVNKYARNAHVTNMKNDLCRELDSRKYSPTFHSNEGEPVLVVKSLIDKIDIKNIKTMCDYVKINYPSQCLYREFQNVVVNYTGDEMIIEDNNSQHGYEDGGSNDVVFMEGHMQEIMPTLLDHIILATTEAALSAKWYPHPKHLGVRCIENLLYTSGGRLYMHTDSDSIFTIVIMLSDPCESDFTGGDFVIRSHDDTSIRIALKQGEALMFDSCTMHGVESITTGERSVLVLELWPYQDAVKGDCRPSVKKYSSRHKLPTFLQCK